MKKLFLFFYILGLMPIVVCDLSAQNTTSFELGSGLNFNLNNGAYQFKLSGMIQPSISFEKTNTATPDYYFNVKRTYFNISGSALKEKVSFFLQTDFSLGTPLLDAWVAYKPISDLTISLGQKQSIAKDRKSVV